VYEYEQYVAARKLLPRMGKKIGTPDGKGTVADVHPLEDSVTVYIEESGRKRYHREELIPLAELEALAKKAKEPCSKHGDGECDCGKQPGERRADEIDDDE
jgi:cell fate regulator YaaT (PSP1 superfamily)